ncbi:unnamed protein product [Notodromas monacha]|uniref:Uncharacterized protein n=1 Tax=Notodromas monacha TaxID=399045 RepID=A0A7R9GI36_9CRUS|nr:unnamed protein product [Notodromas monacha]CAG0922172.1 unnamed protein product [Notodromas monacha]
MPGNVRVLLFLLMLSYVSILSGDGRLSSVSFNHALVRELILITIGREGMSGSTSQHWSDNPIRAVPRLGKRPAGKKSIVFEEIVPVAGDKRAARPRTSSYSSSSLKYGSSDVHQQGTDGIHEEGFIKGYIGRVSALLDETDGVSPLTDDRNRTDSWGSLPASDPFLVLASVSKDPRKSFESESREDEVAYFLQKIC